MPIKRTPAKSTFSNIESNECRNSPASTSSNRGPGASVTKSVLTPPPRTTLLASRTVEKSSLSLEKRIEKVGQIIDQAKILPPGITAENRHATIKRLARAKLTSPKRLKALGELLPQGIIIKNLNHIIGGLWRGKIYKTLTITNFEMAIKNLGHASEILPEKATSTHYCKIIAALAEGGIILN